jgi:ketosteroid isomerase-like protein
MVQARGAYLTIWKRQADGGWKALYDVGNLR